MNQHDCFPGFTCSLFDSCIYFQSGQGLQGSGAAHLYKPEGINKETGGSANGYGLIQNFLEMQGTGSCFHEV